MPLSSLELSWRDKTQRQNLRKEYKMQSSVKCLSQKRQSEEGFVYSPAVPWMSHVQNGSPGLDAWVGGSTKAGSGIGSGAWTTRSNLVGPLVEPAQGSQHVFHAFWVAGRSTWLWHGASWLLWCHHSLVDCVSVLVVSRQCLVSSQTPGHALWFSAHMPGVPFSPLWGLFLLIHPSSGCLPLLTGSWSLLWLSAAPALTGERMPAFPIQS